MNRPSREPIWTGAPSGGKPPDLPCILWTRAWYQRFSGVATELPGPVENGASPSTDSIPMGVWCDLKSQTNSEEKSGAV